MVDERKMKTVVKGISRKIFRRITLESGPTVHVGGGPMTVRKNDPTIRLGSVFSRKKSFCFENCIFARI